MSETGSEIETTESSCSGTESASSVDQTKKRVCVVGGGNWGTVIGKIVSENVLKMHDFDNTVKMYVNFEMYLGRELHDIINEDHENAKYLQGIKLPRNLVAVHGIVKAVRDADFIIFVVPRSFIRPLCVILAGIVKPGAVALSLIKCMMKADVDAGGVDLISEFITRKLKIPCWVMMGATAAQEVAEEKFSEAVIGCKHEATARVFRHLLQTKYLRIQVTEDHKTVELCGALKHILAFAIGFCEAMRTGHNSKSAIIRVGLNEMMKFVETFYPGANVCTFLMPCGVSDIASLMNTTRNSRIATAFLRTTKTIEELEESMLKGHTAEGHIVAEQVYNTVVRAGKVAEFPLFTSVHLICIGEILSTELLDRCVTGRETVAEASPFGSHRPSTASAFHSI